MQLQKSKFIDKIYVGSDRIGSDRIVMKFWKWQGVLVSFLLSVMLRRVMKVKPQQTL